MTVYLLLGVGWLLLSLPVSVLVGKCISVGQAGETARHAGAAARAETTDPAPGTDAAGGEASYAAGLPVPAQRQPVESTRTVT